MSRDPDLAGANDLASPAHRAGGVESHAALHLPARRIRQTPPFMPSGRLAVRRVVGGRDPTDLPDLAQVQDEAIAFGRVVLKDRHTPGIDDVSAWAVRVTNELGRGLAVLPLSKVKKLPCVAPSRPVYDLARHRQSFP